MAGRRGGGGGPDRDEMRQRLIGIAEQLIEAEGLEAVQARRVAEIARCAVGTIYNLFQDLDELIIGANMRTLQLLGAALGAAHEEAAHSAVEARLMVLAEAYFAFAVTQNKRWRAVFEHQMAKDRAVPEAYREMQAALFALVESVLASQIGDEGQRRSAARALFGGVHGIVSLALDRKLGELDIPETERQITFVVGSVAQGLAAASSRG